MSNGISFILPGSSAFDPSNVIASVFPKATNLRDLVLYGANLRKVFGQTPGLPTQNGSPTINAHSFVGAANGTGYTTVVPDANNKVIAILAKWPESGPGDGAMGASLFAGGSTDQGDALFFHQASGQMRIAASRASTTNMTASIDGVKAATDDGKFYLFVGSWSYTSVRGRYVADGAVHASSLLAVTGRASAKGSNIRVANSYQSGSYVYHNPIEIAASAIWTGVGVDLSDAEILSLRDWFVANLGDDIDIGA